MARVRQPILTSSFGDDLCDSKSEEVALRDTRRSRSFRHRMPQCNSDTLGIWLFREPHSTFSIHSVRQTTMNLQLLELPEAFTDANKYESDPSNIQVTIKKHILTLVFTVSNDEPGLIDLWGGWDPVKKRFGAPKYIALYAAWVHFSLSH
jgi:hypothetical protein